MANETAFQNVEQKVKTIPTPMPDQVLDIDFSDKLYDNIISNAESGVTDLNTLNSFTSISQSRDDVCTMLDIMAEDPIISQALNIYAADATETNEKGQIVWAESDDSAVLNMVQYLLNLMNVDKNAFGWVYSLIKYGDLYLRLYHESEVTPLQPQELNEEVTIKAYKAKDRLVEFLDRTKNPAEVFDLQRFGRTEGYIKTHIFSESATNNSDINFGVGQQSLYKYNFKKGDVDIFPATSFVHACLEDNSSRTSEEVSISTDDEDLASVYTVKRGQSILYNAFRIWRELSLLENSVILNRITKSSIVRTVSVEVGDMEKNDVRNLLQRIKSMIEQKSALSVGNSYENYTNPGPIENIIYVPTHDGKGAITTSEIGGQVDVGDLVDLDYFKDKLFGALGIPKQYLGDVSDAAGFSGGESLALISSQYAKKVKQIQNTMCQALTDAVNILLLDRGLKSYVNRFTIKMQAPTTKEEKDRKDNMATSINNIREIMSLISDSIEDPVSKLTILKDLLTPTLANATVAAELEAELDKLIQDSAPAEVEASEESLADMPMDLDQIEDETVGEQEPIPEVEADNNLPSFDQMGIDYTDVQ